MFLLYLGRTCTSSAVWWTRSADHCVSVSAFSLQQLNSLPEVYHIISTWARLSHFSCLWTDWQKGESDQKLHFHLASSQSPSFAQRKIAFLVISSPHFLSPWCSLLPLLEKTHCEETCFEQSQHLTVTKRLEDNAKTDDRMFKYPRGTFDRLLHKILNNASSSPGC